MPRVSREQTRSNRRKVVEVAATRLREHGLEGVGVVDIMRSAGLTHGGFYGQFASKEALLDEAFVCALEQDRQHGLQALLTGRLSRRQARSAGRTCPLAALASDIARKDPNSSIRVKFTESVRHLLELAGGRTADGDEADRQRAIETVTVLIGSIVLARAVNDVRLQNELLDAAYSKGASSSA